MDQQQLEAFLALGDELHFGRAAARMGLSQSRVSRLIGALERDVGAPLFIRTSRRVALTPLGLDLRADLQPVASQLRSAMVRARASARSTADGSLCIGFTATTGGEVLNELVRAFETRFPAVTVTLREIPIFDSDAHLRSGAVDVLLNWSIVDEPDITRGPVLAWEDRVVAVGAGHPLAMRSQMSVEELCEYEVAEFRPALPPALVDAFAPRCTPSGRPIPRSHPVTSAAETWALVARGRIVHPTVAAMSHQLARTDIVLVPLTDMPALPLGLLWCAAHENARIRELATVALDRRPPHSVHGHGTPKP